jgi:hypothetical protein
VIRGTIDCHLGRRVQADRRCTTALVAGSVHTDPTRCPLTGYTFYRSELHVDMDALLPRELVASLEQRDRRATMVGVSIDRSIELEGDSRTEDIPVPSQLVLSKLTEIPPEVRPGVAEGLWDQLRSQFGAPDIRRIRGLLECWSGVRPKALRHGQEAVNDLYLPDLEHDEPWLDPALFELAGELEANFRPLRDEYDRLQSSGISFKAYGRGLDESPEAGPLPGNPEGWKEFALIHEFEPLHANCDQAPVASRLSETAIAYHDVVAQFTYLVLEPGAVIVPHADPANFLVSCHLGIKVPAGCSLTVGDEARAWTEGKCLTFNNSFRHQAQNRGTEARGILSIHALHPALTPVERSAIAALIEILTML